MKTTKLLVVLFVGLVLISVACSKQTTVVSTQKQTAASTAGQAASGQQTAKANSDDVSAAYQAGMDCLKSGVRVCSTINFKKGTVGDTLAFPFAISNQLPETKRFTITVKFLKAQFSLGNAPVDISKDNMADWLSGNKLESYYELKPQEKLSKPIVINIGDLVNTDTPTPSNVTYMFEVRASIANQNGFLSDYDSPKQFSVRVQ